MIICGFVMFSYFMVTAGIAYDMINEPPAVGSYTDPATGKAKPVTFMPYRVNGQYIIEGLSGGLMYTLGGFGLILLDQAHSKSWSKGYRITFLATGAFCVLAAYSATMLFLRIKMPSYLSKSF